MKFESFRNLEKTATDYRAVILAISAANRAAHDVTRSIENRISAEKKQAVSRAAELTEIIGDPARSETIKRMARAELGDLKQRNYRPSTTEQAAFDAAVAELEQALTDARALQTKLSGLLKEARDELRDIEKTTVHDPSNNLDIFANWPGGLRQDFSAMLARVGGEASA